MALSSSSRYLHTEIIEYRSPITGDLLKPPFVDIRQRYSTKEPSDRQITYDQVDSWAGLGFRFLHDANAWWVIADLSGVIDPFEELTEMRRLRTPTVSQYQLNILPTDKGSF